MNIKNYMTNSPKNNSVSIITSVFNNVSTIENCILSVQKQNFEHLEHIIVDAGSTDGTLEIIKKYSDQQKLIYISEKDNGLYDGLNKGFKLAQGRIVAWLDSDNYYSPKIVDEVYSIFEKNNNIDVVYGNVTTVKNGKKVKDFIVRSDINFKKALKNNTGAIPVQPGVFFKKDLFEKVNGFNTTYKIAGDYDFWLKVLKTNPNLYYLNEIFGFFSLEDAGLSQSFGGIIHGLKEMVKIEKEHNQTFYGKIRLVTKYAKGLLSMCRKKILNKNA